MLHMASCREEHGLAVTKLLWFGVWKSSLLQQVEMLLNLLSALLPSIHPSHQVIPGMQPKRHQGFIGMHFLMQESTVGKVGKAPGCISTMGKLIFWTLVLDRIWSWFFLVDDKRHFHWKIIGQYITACIQQSEIIHCTPFSINANIDAKVSDLE